MAKKVKSPKAAAAPGATKKAVPDKQASTLGREEDPAHLIVRFSRTDRGGPWCISNISANHHLKLLQCIEGVETRTIHEVFNGNPRKDYTLADIPNKEAKKRLSELEYDDRDQISRLQVGNLPRLYGFRKGRYFYVLWWDPQHEIWPSAKK